MKTLQEALSKSQIKKIKPPKVDISIGNLCVIIRNMYKIKDEDKEDIIIPDKSVAPFMIKPKDEADKLKQKYKDAVNLYTIIRGKYFSLKEFANDYIYMSARELKYVC